jgi:aminoglycoside phosphotransferase (APT) family kinase protein
MTDVDPMISYITTKHNRLTKGKPVSVNLSGSINIILIVGDKKGEKYVFRIARPDNLHAQKQLLLENNFWSFISPLVQIPHPKHILQSAPDEKYCYVCYPYVEGIPMSDEMFSSLDKRTERKFARDLAAFLRPLHEFPVQKLPQEYGQTSALLRMKRKEYYRLVNEQVFPHLGAVQKKWTMHVFDQYLSNDALWNFSTCLLHGDLKRSHILVDPGTLELAGIIDFGFRIDDPAVDFGFFPFGQRFTSQVIHYSGNKQDPLLEERIHFQQLILPFDGLLHGVLYNNKKILNNHIEWLDLVINKFPIK